MLALFSDQAYSLPGSVYAGSENEDEQLLDLRPHLSNTCLQVSLPFGVVKIVDEA